MLIKRIFYRELISNAVKIFTVILLILPLTELFKLFDAVSSGSLPKGAVFTTVIYGVLASFPQALTITCLLTVVITLNRMCKDQEYVIWLTSGVSPFYWFRLTAIFAVSMMVICSVSTMYITPWANLKVKIYTNYLFKEEVNTFLSPGVFKEDTNTGQVYYLKNYSLLGGEANNIFAQYTNNKTNMLYNITSKSGDISNDNGLLLLQLHSGSQIQLTNDPKNNTYSLIKFDTFQAKINQKFDEHAVIGNSFNANESNINKLFKHSDKSSLAELSFRIGTTISILLMSLVAVPISLQVGRRQNGFVFILPPLIYGLYNQMIFTINDYILNSIHHPLWIMLAGQIMHIVMFGIIVLYIYIKSFPKGQLFSKNKQ